MISKAPITKTQFLAYLECKEEAWLERNEVGDTRILDPVTKLAIEDGQEVDRLAKTYFTSATNIKAAFGKEGRVTLQETFIVEGKYRVISDVVFYPANGGPVILVEVKATTAKYDKGGQIKPEGKHILDLAFQQFVLESTGLPVARTGLLLLNSEYRLSEEGLNLNNLFSYAEVTALTNDVLPEVRQQAPNARSFLQGPEPSAWEFTVCENKGACKWMHRSVKLPDYSIFDISGARVKHLQALLSARILDIMDVPESADLFKNMHRQVRVAQAGLRHCDQPVIDKAFAALSYPHYFLDYETVALAVPNVLGMWPYQRLTFQYSLHIRTEQGSELEHREYLLEDRSQGMLPLLQQLVLDIPHDSGGTVIVWNKGFEKSVNTDMAETYPEFSVYLNGLNARVWDLMEVFKGEWVDDPRFYGSASIKKVLPALAPEFSYSNLVIGEGGTASYSWHLLSTGRIDEDRKKLLRKDLLDYCRQDTLAMVVLMDWAARDTSDTHKNYFGL